MNQRFLVPSGRSAAASAQATLPDGHSPPIPTPVEKRQAVRRSIIRGVGPGNGFAVSREEIILTIPEAFMPLRRPNLSTIQPKPNFPMTIPAKVI